MNKLYFLITLLFMLISANERVFSQNDVKSTVIGNPSIMESAANIVADNAGNTYIGGLQGNKGLIVKQDPLHVTIWSKTLSFTTNPNDDVTIAFLDIIGDTIFGCGKIHQFNQAKGTFYFKMNAQTGTMYWSKFEVISNGYLSCMRYSNGKYFLIGGSYGSAQVTAGKALAVSSQTGNLIWETPLLKYFMPLTATSPTTRAFFLNSTEVKNGQFYITGYTDGNTSGVTNWLGMPLLIGITDAGSVFMEKHLLFPYTPTNAQRFEGAQIRWDMDDHLVISCFEMMGASPQFNNTIVVKCDLLGNILFANGYDIGTNVTCTVDAMNETDSSYVLFGWGGFSVGPFDGLYVLKIDKAGNLEKCNSIQKPNVFYNPLSLGWTHLVGNSAFVNGTHYFTMEESSDINQFILNEELDFIDDCSRLDSLPVNVNPLSVSMPQLLKVILPSTMIFQDGAILEDVPVFAYCDGVSLDLVQNSGCSQATIQANIAGFTDPTFYWSNGSSSGNTTIANTTDTVFVRVLDTKCCELIDTIVPVLFPSSFAMNLPADTTVCLQSGNSFTITPTFSGANAPLQYLWSNTSTGTSLSITASGTYWVELSDSCLTLRDSIVVTVSSLPVIGNTPNITVCEDDFPTTLSPTVSTGASVLWNDGLLTPQRSVNGPGSYTIFATNACGTVNATIVVLQTNLSDVQLISSIDTCLQNGGVIILVPTFSDVNSVLWSDGTTSNQLSVLGSGMYTVYGSNACGIDSATCSVIINHFPELNLPTNLDTCFEIGVGFSYTVIGSQGSYQWSSGSQSATEWISQEGVYSCTLTNQCGSITDSMRVRRLTAVDLYFPNDSLLECEKQLSVSNLQIETNYNLEIVAPNGDLAGTFITESGWYIVHAFNACGEKWDSIYVNLQNEQYFYLPNSFTPNGDSYNDRFEFKGENIIVRDMRIFNRWGEEVFSQAGAFTGWDGIYRGEICPDGVYAIRVIYEDCFGIPTEFSGHVSLIR
ncbi:T9SS type B sorting domain-containing protein [Fluviicola taffensis]|uniref:Uncharacterized protein n=1 Tax=Fluviicola taffensis (strain DSM 16823 / NCIMB 13979 / RW262) TaxID=755732 RepID=F2IFB2_FLUTR|nr:T9SS type B sorting domain-containing protein [Fluviicola taffensis]AEA44597.1 hypothetical protein Fluta_2613 [Fluviicola taffensis DSM 16823]